MEYQEDRSANMEISVETGALIRVVDEADVGPGMIKV